MKRILAILMLIALLAPGYLIVQAQSSKQFLKIGDKVPDFLFPIKNYKTPAARISDFKGKLVILDLWATYCSSCIAAMPHINELQKKFDGRIQIIMVTKDDDTKVSRLALHSDNVKNNKLPSATNATKLAGLFHYLSLPTHIWIDENGIVKFITSGTGANEKNIGDYLNGKLVSLREKKDIKIDSDKPLIVNWFPYYKEISIYSYLTPSQKEYAANMGNGMLRNQDGSIHEIHTGWSSLKDLYKIAYGMPTGGSRFSNSRILMNFKDAERYETIPGVDYRASGLTYMFQLINNNKIPDQRIFAYIQNQFDMVFNLKSSWEKRMVPCLILRKVSESEKLLSKGGNYKGEYKGNIFSAQNLRWGQFIAGRTSNSPYQLIDETGLAPDTNIDINIDARMEQMDLVNNSLMPYGLKLFKEERLLDWIVLNDPN